MKGHECFIEFHPRDRYLTSKEYLKLRRKNLNKNNYKGYNLIIMK